MWFHPNVKQESIAERSAGILDSFKQTIKSLEEINNEVEIIVSNNEMIIEDLKKESQDLTDVANKNNKVIANIGKLLGE